MSWQDYAAYALVALAAGFLLARWRRRRAAGNCCGERECPAAKGMVERFTRSRR